MLCVLVPSVVAVSSLCVKEERCKEDGGWRMEDGGARLTLRRVVASLANMGAYKPIFGGSFVDTIPSC